MEKRSKTIQVPIAVRNENKTFTIDLPGNAKTVKGIVITTRIKLEKLAVNRHYYGSAVEPGSFDNSFIQTLNNSPIENLVKIFDLNALPTEFVFYARPLRLDGEPSFEVNGVSYGFLSYKIVSVTDPDTGFVEDYKLYQSVEDGLGNIKLLVG